MIDDLKELLQHHPFEPFTIVLTSGDRYLVENPHNVALMESRIFYAFPRERRWCFIRLNQIAALEAQEPAA